jgi:hypothetical protein
MSTTMRSAEGSGGAVIRHSNDTFQRGLWATPRQSVANWFAGQHSKPMSSFYDLYTLHSQNFLSMGGSRKRGLSSNSGAPQATGLLRLTEWMVWDQGRHPVSFMSDLLQNCSEAVLMGVEAFKAGSTDSLGGRSQSASREVNARDHF